MLVGVPLPFALHLDARAVDQQVQRTVRAAVGDVNLQCLLAARQRAEGQGQPSQADQAQQALDEPASPSSRGQWRSHGSIWRSAISNSTFIVRLVWMAASL